MISHIMAAVLATSSASSGSKTDGPATPINRLVPDYPTSCRMPNDDTPPPQVVTVVYTVTSEGVVEAARVRESTDVCFNETAIAAVRSWRFRPARANGVAVDQEEMETTFRFVVGETTGALDFDARPLKRYPPRYPERCFAGADKREDVFVEFDVTADGDTTNARIVDSTNACLNSSALLAVKKWKYRAKIVDGEPVERKGVQTVMTYELASRYDPPRNRPIVGRKLNAIGADIRANRDPRQILADLAEIEKKYGDDFTRTELRAFHQLRGAARLSAKDYRGALDDFRIVQKLGLSGESGEAIAKTIDQLEAYLAADGAAAPPPPGS